jgi:hypothetical protein
MGLRAGTRATGSVSAQALGPSAATSTVEVSPASIVNDNVAIATITAYVRDPDSALLAGYTPTITVTPATGNTLGAVTAGAFDGAWTATFKSTTAEAKTITASVGGRAIAVAGLTVTPVADDPVDAEHCLVTLSAATVAVDGVVTATLTSYDSTDTALTAGGYTVAFAHAGGTSNPTFSAVTDVGDGTYTCIITGETAGTATTLSATIAAANVTTAMPTLTVTGAFTAPNVLVNVGFESDDHPDPRDEVGWSGFLNGNGGFPPVGDGTTTLERSAEQAYEGSTAAKYAWAANTSDAGGTFLRLLSSSGKEWWELGYVARADDEWWMRFYLYLVAGWSITSHLKYMLVTNSSHVPHGGFGLDNGAGLNFGLYGQGAPTTGGFATILSKAVLDAGAGAWHSMEFHLRQNGDANPNVAFWYDGTQIIRANGQDPRGDGLDWSGNRLYFERGNSDHLGGFKFNQNRNGGNTGSGTMYIDRVAVSTAGRIGP